MVKTIIKKRKEGEVLETLSKQTLVAIGSKASPVIKAITQELHTMKRPDSVLLGKKHQDLHPFTYQEAFQSFVVSKHASLFVVGSNSKKRPNNLVIGRCYSEEILDMVEFGVKEFTSALKFKGEALQGLKPMFLFQGDLFETDATYARIKNLFLDFFGGKHIEKVDTRGLNQLISLSATEDGDLHFRLYQVKEQQLNEVGPRFTLSLRRHSIASEARFKAATKQPKLKNKVKNVTTNPLKEKRGRVHVQQQDIKTIALKKRKLKLK